MCCSLQHEALKDAAATHTHCCRPLRLASIWNGYPSVLQLVILCTFCPLSATVWPLLNLILRGCNNHRQALNERRKRRCWVVSTDTVRASSYFSKRKQRHGEREVILVVGLLQLSTKISVFSSLFELRGFKHRGRVLYLCLGLNGPPVVFSKHCGWSSEHQPSAGFGWENWELLTDMNTHTKTDKHILPFCCLLPLFISLTSNPKLKGNHTTQGLNSLWTEKQPTHKWFKYTHLHRHKHKNMQIFVINWLALGQPRKSHKQSTVHTNHTTA